LISRCCFLQFISFYYKKVSHFKPESCHYTKCKNFLHIRWVPPVRYIRARDWYLQLRYCVPRHQCHTGNENSALHKYDFSSIKHHHVIKHSLFVQIVILLRILLTYRILITFCLAYRILITFCLAYRILITISSATDLSLIDCVRITRIFLKIVLWVIFEIE
jgi:hypothetical protein